MVGSVKHQHHYQPDHDGGPDHNGKYPCGQCRLPKGNAVHTVAARSDDERAVAARIVGEGAETVDTQEL